MTPVSSLHEEEEEEDLPGTVHGTVLLGAESRYCTLYAPSYLGWAWLDWAGLVCLVVASSSFLGG